MLICFELYNKGGKVGIIEYGVKDIVVFLVNERD